MLELNREKVKVVGWNAWFSTKNNIEYALLEYKTSKWFKGVVYVAPASSEVQELVKTLDSDMGREITLVTSIEE